MTQYVDLKDYMARKPPQETAHDIIISAARCLALTGGVFSCNSVRDILATLGYDPREHLNNYEAEAGQTYRQLVTDREASMIGVEPSRNPKSNGSMIGVYRLTPWGREVAQLRFKTAATPVPPAQGSLFPK